MKKLDDKIIVEIEQNIKQLLELINKKPNNELILKDVSISSNTTINESNVLVTKYCIDFTTLLTEKESE